MSQSAAAAAPHVPDVRPYMLVFGALMFLTVVTVLVSWLHLPKGPAILAALMIATVKASLVAAFFMHLKGERLLIYTLLGLTVFFMAVLFALPITDTAVTNGLRRPLAIGTPAAAPAEGGAAAPAADPSPAAPAE